MTPTAITPAGRRSSQRGSSTEGPPFSPKAPARPRSPRRVSGPATGRLGAASRTKSTAGTKTAPRTKRAPETRTAPRTKTRTNTTTRTRTTKRRRTSLRTRLGAISLPRPRRQSGPARPAAQGSLRDRSFAFIRALPDHPWLDRVVRGRAWIAVLFIMLAGIVAMQVEVLKLNRTMGNAIEQATALQSRNELLRANVSSLADDQRIERLAAAQGMVMPAPQDLGFLSVNRTTVARAANHIRIPDSGLFQSLLTSNGGIASTPVPPVMSGAATASRSPSGG